MREVIAQYLDRTAPSSVKGASPKGQAALGGIAVLDDRVTVLERIVSRVVEISGLK